MATLTQDTLDSVESTSLDSLDVLTHIAIGDGTTGATPSDLTLENELTRELTDSITKTPSTGTFDFSSTFGLSDAQGFTISEVGLFDAASSGNMGLREILPVSVFKDEVELIIEGKIVVTANNS